MSLLTDLRWEFEREFERLSARDPEAASIAIAASIDAFNADALAGRGELECLQSQLAEFRYWAEMIATAEEQ